MKSDDAPVVKTGDRLPFSALGSPDWEQLAPDFEHDGGLRDIYVLGTSTEDRQRLFDSLRTWHPPAFLTVSGATVPLPQLAEDAFKTARDAGATLVIQLGPMRLHCHFFCREEIEFDLDPREVLGAAEGELLKGFLIFLGELTGKNVLLTMEGSKEAVILSYAPGSGQILWSPPKYS